MSSEEKARIDAIAADSWYGKGTNGAAAIYCGDVFARSWRGARCLELGPAEGLMTPRIAADFRDLTLVEGSERFCAELAIRFPQARVVHSLFEDFAPDGRYDTIVLGHVLEHVVDPVGLLRAAKGWLAPKGAIYAAVPNARSVHRQAAVTMGILPTEHSLNESDVHHGHRRVYDPETFRADFRAAGLQIRVFGGYFLKTLSSAQIDAQWTPQMLDAYLRLGELYPDIAASIYVIASDG